MNSVSSNAVKQAITASQAYSSGQVSIIDSTWSHSGTLLKSGKVVNLQLRVWHEEETTVTGGQVLGVIPVGFRPLSHAWTEFQMFDSTATHQLINIDSLGNIKAILGQTYSRLDMYINSTWITA